MGTSPHPTGTEGTGRITIGGTQGEAALWTPTSWSEEGGHPTSEPSPAAPVSSSSLTLDPSCPFLLESQLCLASFISPFADLLTEGTFLMS